MQQAGQQINRVPSAVIATPWRPHVIRPWNQTSPKLAPLNGMAVLYEWDVDEHGNAQTPLWEWK
jgi:hypothetical protein